MNPIQKVAVKIIESYNEHSIAAFSKSSPSDDPYRILCLTPTAKPNTPFFQIEVQLFRLAKSMSGKQRREWSLPMKQVLCQTCEGSCDRSQMFHDHTSLRLYHIHVGITNCPYRCQPCNRLFEHHLHLDRHRNGRTLQNSLEKYPVK